jgi:hypothetical protein
MTYGKKREPKQPDGELAIFRRLGAKKDVDPVERALSGLHRRVGAIERLSLTADF